MNFYRLLADAVVALHALYVAVVVLGLVAILVGAALRWQWIHNFWFRAIHLLMIAVVVAQALLGWLCPLTIWENQLRVRAGQTVDDATFIGRWAHALLFYEGPPWVFTLCYCLFGVAVLVALWLIPPRWPFAAGIRRKK